LHDPLFWHTLIAPDRRDGSPTPSLSTPKQPAFGTATAPVALLLNQGEHMDFENCPQDNYHVEVSGWDAKESFFVEKTVLDWKSDDKKAILLRTPIRIGSILFVRLLQPIQNGASFPVAYEALTSAGKPENGASHVSLERLRPRASYKATHAENSLAVRVA
jgi:hypothetical protein